MQTEATEAQTRVLSMNLQISADEGCKASRLERSRDGEQRERWSGRASKQRSREGG